MEQETVRLQPSVPLEIIDLEQNLENLNDVNSFKNSLNNIKEMITHFNDEIHKSEKKNKNIKILNTNQKAVDSFVNIGATSTPLILSTSSCGLILLPKCAGISCGSSLGTKLLYKIVLKKSSKYKELNELTFKSFENLYRKSLQDNEIGKNEYESLCDNFTKYLDE